MNNTALLHERHTVAAGGEPMWVCIGDGLKW